jgi:hypothetical protein
MCSFARRQWLTPVILATQEAEIRRTTVQSQHRQIVCETLPQKHPSQKRAGGVAQGVGPELKPQYCKKKKKKVFMLSDYCKQLSDMELVLLTKRPKFNSKS